VAAAWSGSGSGSGDLLKDLGEVEQRARTFVTTGGYKHSRTPAPQALEGEAH
jgi:hypothetical protein